MLCIVCLGRNKLFFRLFLQRAIFVSLRAFALVVFVSNSISVIILLVVRLYLSEELSIRGQLLWIILQSLSPKAVDLLTPFDIIIPSLESLDLRHAQLEQFGLIQVVFEFESLGHLLFNCALIKEDAHVVLPVLDACDELT